jgi:hypothetical protein
MFFLWSWRKSDQFLLSVIRNELNCLRGKILYIFVKKNIIYFYEKNITYIYEKNNINIFFFKNYVRSANCYVPPARFQVLQVEDVFNLNKHETFNTFNTQSVKGAADVNILRKIA